jgi:hypothetical protein
LSQRRFRNSPELAERDRLCHSVAAARASAPHIEGTTAADEDSLRAQLGRSVAAGQSDDCTAAARRSAICASTPSCWPTRLTTPIACAVPSKAPVLLPTSRRWSIAAGNPASARCSTARATASTVFVNRIRHFRRLATRYEKHAMLKLAAVHLWLRHNESVT